jgi:hypothetical protein
VPETLERHFPDHGDRGGVQRLGHIDAGEVAPTITLRSSSTTIRAVPGAPRPTKLPPALPSVDVSTARTFRPASSALCSV